MTKLEQFMIVAQRIKYNATHSFETKLLKMYAIGDEKRDCALLYTLFPNGHNIQLSIGGKEEIIKVYKMDNFDLEEIITLAPNFKYVAKSLLNGELDEDD